MSEKESPSEKILERIRKLLSLSSSPNEHEAQTALKLAKALAETYNLDIRSIKLKVHTSFEKKTYDKIPGFMQLLMLKLAGFTNIKVHYYNENIVAWGEGRNIELFNTILESLIAQVNNSIYLLKADDTYIYMTGGDKRSYMASYKHGLVAGIITTLDELMPQGNNLVPYKEILDAKYAQAFPKLVDRNITMTTRHTKAKLRGFMEGKTMSIFKRVKE